jgi:hypothetical protein
MPVKRRVSKQREQISPAMLAFLRDEPMPEDAGIAAWWIESETNPGPKASELWPEFRDEILADWIAEAPGTRPSMWWRLDAPEPRRRLGGIGTPAHEVLAHVPRFWCGIPIDWVTQSLADFYDREERSKPFEGVAVSRKDPPLFESEAAFLDRHGLFLPGERKRLGADDFEPVSLLDIIDFGDE